MSDNNDHHYHPTELTEEEKAIVTHMEAETSRAIRTRGRMLPFAGALTVLLLCVLTLAWFETLTGIIEPTSCVIFGALLSIFSIPCHLLGGNRNVISSVLVRSVLYVASILINTAGTSLSIAAYYVHLGKVPTTAEMILCGGCAMLLFGVLALLISLWPHRHGLMIALVGLTTLGLAVSSVVFWIRSEDKTLWSLAFFLLLWVGISIISLCAACSDENSPWLRFASFASFGLFMVVAAVVMIILICAAGDCDCDGDCCDCDGSCCDCGGGGGGNSKPRRQRRSK